MTSTGPPSVCIGPRPSAVGPGALREPRHKRNEFQVKPGLFVRVEREHKALAKDGGSAASSGDAAPVGDGAGEQPLGKLSKAQIQKGDAVLDKIEKLLAEAGAEGAALPPKLKAQFQSHSAE